MGWSEKVGGTETDKTYGRTDTKGDGQRKGQEEGLIDRRTER